MIPHRVYAIMEDHKIWNIKRFDSLQDAIEEAKFYYVNNPGAVECTFYPCEEGDKYIDGIFYHFDLKTQTWEKIEKIASCEEEVEILKNQIQYLESLLIPSIDTDDCTVNELKEFMIKKSKLALEDYLLANPLVSDCHGGKTATYTITKEKWDSFNTRFSMHLLKKMNYMSDGMMWNATGEPLEYWYDEECFTLQRQWEKIINPLIQHQQKIEKSINEATKKKDILAISFNYAEIDIRNK